MSKDYLEAYEITFRGETILQHFKEECIMYDLDFNGHYIVQVFYCEEGFEETGIAKDRAGNSIAILPSDLSYTKVG